MANTSTSIRSLLLQLLGDDFTEIYGVPCTVIPDSVDESGDYPVCDCQPITGDAILLGVRLQADTGNGLLMIPADGSVVIVQPINNSTGVVTMFSQVERIKFLDGSYGGLTKTQELKTQLDKTNAVVTAIVNSLTGWTPVTSDGGAALKAYFAGQIAGKTVGNYANIENDKITHGTN